MDHHEKFSTGKLGYDGPLYDGFSHMTDDMLGPSPVHIKYSSYIYDPLSPSYPSSPVMEYFISAQSQIR